MKRTLLALSFMAVAAGSAIGQSPNDTAPFVYLPEIPNALVLNGSIDFRAPLAFKRALQAHPETQVIILQSDGGSVQAALLIAEEIYDRQLSTLIPEKSLCASACSYVFFAGVNRLASGQLGVHQISGSQDIESAQLNLSDVIETLSKYDVPPAVITRMLRTPPKDIYIFNPAEISSLRINRTPGIVQTASPANPADEDTAKQFVLGVITASSLPKSDLLALASKIYSDDISFYGTPRSKSDVLAEKATYVDRWPMRSSVVQPDSVVSSCAAGRCRVSGMYEWQVFDPKRKKQASGSAQFVYEIDMSGLRIVVEDGKVISRRKKGER